MRLLETIGNTFRNKRFSFFEDHIQNLPKPLNIIDLGGTELVWVNRGFQNREDYQITLVNLDDQKPESRWSNIKSIRGDVTDLSFIEDHAFDIVFSNSVIEHLHSFENQQKMAKESRR